MAEFELPEVPMGDPADALFLNGEEGDIDEDEMGDIGDDDAGGETGEGPHGAISFAEMGGAALGVDEMGAPIVLKGKGSAALSRLSNLRGRALSQAIQRTAIAHGAKKAQTLKAHTAVRRLAKNYGVLFERVAGGRVISATLGSGARLQPSMVAALKQAVHGSTPFQPQTFAFVPSGADVIVDIRTALNSVIGTAFPIFYAGFIITLQASVFNTNVGAFITIRRNLGAIPTVLSLVQTIQLESGVRNVQILDLNGALIAGHPRFYAPQVFGALVADPNTEVRISGLPTNYTATLRFLQPGDAQVDHFLRTL